MKYKLSENCALFMKLLKDPPKWWINLKNDKELYIDIRKSNYINVYHNGGSLLKLTHRKAFNGEIAFEYVPIENINSPNMKFIFNNNAISFADIMPITLNSFNKESLNEIKKKIRKKYPNKSEKGLQGQYVIKNTKNENGFFIDTEFQFGQQLRIDLIWLDFKYKKIFFVELKTIGDKRLFNNEIEIQLQKYNHFIKNNKNDLLMYYNKLFMIKKQLMLLPNLLSSNIYLSEFDIVEKPILLIGNCTQAWIDYNSKHLNSKIKEHTHSCIYHGDNTFRFEIPKKTKRNIFYFGY